MVTGRPGRHSTLDSRGPFRAEINTYDNFYDGGSSDHLEIVDRDDEVVARIVEADETDAEFICDALNSYNWRIQPPVIQRRQRRTMRG